MLVLVHIAAGSLTLSCFWATAATRKGSRPHVLAGRVFLFAMASVVVTGIPLAFTLIERGQPVFAMFLGYLLALVTSTSLTAWRAVRLRRHRQAYYGP